MGSTAGRAVAPGRFGANAAWLRLAVLTYNVLSGLKPPRSLSQLPRIVRCVSGAAIASSFAAE